MFNQKYNLSNPDGITLLLLRENIRKFFIFLPDQILSQYQENKRMNEI